MITAELQRRLLIETLAVVRDSKLVVSLPFILLKELITSASLQQHFREDWYLKIYPDVAAQVRSGVFESGFDHYIQQGLWSGRLGQPMPVDEAWYAAFYDDVGRALSGSDLSGAKQHFESHGFAEGRAAAAAFLVDPSWYRAEYPEAQLEVRAGKYSTLQHHFNYEGFARGYDANGVSRNRGI